MILPQICGGNRRRRTSGDHFRSFSAAIEKPTGDVTSGLRSAVERAVIGRWRCRGSQFMLLLLGRRVALSLVNRFTQSSPPSPSTPALISSQLIKLRVAHSGFPVSTAVRHRGTMPERRPFVRLPTDVYPVNYGLCLKPDLIDFTFEGKLEAMVEVRVPECVSIYTGEIVCTVGSRYVTSSLPVANRLLTC